jgi:hypothetical protein
VACPCEACYVGIYEHVRKAFGLTLVSLSSVRKAYRGGVWAAWILEHRAIQGLFGAAPPYARGCIDWRNIKPYVF